MKIKYLKGNSFFTLVLHIRIRFNYGLLRFFCLNQDLQDYRISKIRVVYTVNAISLNIDIFKTVIKQYGSILRTNLDEKKS